MHPGRHAQGDAVVDRRRSAQLVGVSAHAAIAFALLAGCSGGTPAAGPEPSRPSTVDVTPTPSDSATPASSRSATTPAPSAPTPTPAPTPDAQRAYADVVALAGDIGPREATSEEFQRAADLVERRFSDLGYDVRRQDFQVPAGASEWGAVPAGTSTNVIATPPGLAPGDRHVVVGAHLDTVPLAPGAEDNASGVAVMLELARLAAGASLAPGSLTSVQVVFVAFGAEEPRAAFNPDHTYHHFGSREYVRLMDPAQRASLVGAISLDRVGVGTVVPVSSAAIGPATLRDALLAAGTVAGVQVLADETNTSSDHLQFELAGLTGARVGSTPYAGYHSPDDVPTVVSPDQLARVITLTWTTLQALR